VTQKLGPMHPGEVLREEFLEPLGLSAGFLAKKAGIPRTRFERIVEEKTGITGETALLLGKLLGTTPEFWLNLQKRYELLIAVKEMKKQLEKIEPVAA
jgi:antitoxin HigA-1